MQIPHESQTHDLTLHFTLTRRGDANRTRARAHWPFYPNITVTQFSMVNLCKIWNAAACFKLDLNSECIFNISTLISEHHKTHFWTNKIQVAQSNTTENFQKLQHMHSFKRKIIYSPWLPLVPRKFAKSFEAHNNQLQTFWSGYFYTFV